MTNRCEYIDEEGCCTLTTKKLQCGVVDLRSCAIKRGKKRADLESHFVNLHRAVMGTNLGLWSRDIKAMSNRQLEDVIVSLDITLKLRQTGQVYIVGHDVPLSISEILFKMLDARRREEAEKRKVPGVQYEFEDALGLLLGIGE